MNKVRNFPFVNQDTYKDICRYIIDERGFIENVNAYLQNGFFVKTDFLDQFKPTHPVILFTGHSDFSIGKNLLHTGILQYENVIKWYAINPEIKEAKLIPLIYGMGDARYPHGNVSIIQKIQMLNVGKSKSVCGNFRVQNNQAQRQACLEYSKIQLINGGGLGTNSFESYLIDVKQSLFQLCPEGNGMDTHRIYESLLVGCIPIVIENLYVQAYRNASFPLLVLKDWAELQNTSLNEELYKAIWNNFDINNLLVIPYLKSLGL